MKDIKLPCKIFKSHLVDAFFITPEKLYREFRTIIEKVEQFKNGRIYFVVKRPRSRFKKVKLRKDGVISFKYEGQSIFSRSHASPISNFLFGLKSIDKRIYPSPEVLQRKIAYVEDSNPILRRSNPDENIIYITPSKGAIDRKNKTLDIKLLPSSLSQFEGKQINVTLFSHQLLRETGDSNVKCKICYIGKANDLKERTDGHKYIQQAQAECGDDEEVYVYFFTPKFDALNINANGTYSVPKDFHNITYEEKVLICEAGLINYFKPELNKYHKNSDITKSGTLKKLSANNYTHFVLHCMFDEDDYFFETDIVKRNGDHKKIYFIKKTNQKN
ncbi:hypothetical protein [Photorhabdus laumondii]|nr:hypothetical protein [Photorhabdus laumondii]